MKIREIIGEEHGAKIEVVRDQNRQTTAIIKSLTRRWTKPL